MTHSFVTLEKTGDWLLDVAYYIDKSTTTATETKSVSMTGSSNLINHKIPYVKRVPFSTIQYKLSNDNLDEYFNIYKLSLYFGLKPL